MDNLIKEIKKNSEFRGLFLGEGYAGVVKYNRHTSWRNKNGLVDKNYEFYRPQLSLGQRDDNKNLVNWIRQNYGGSIWVARQIKGNHNPSLIWTITNIEKISKICEILLDSEIPSKKMESIRIVKEFCDWKIQKGLQSKCSKEDYNKMHKWYLDCKNNHLYEVTK